MNGARWIPILMASHGLTHLREYKFKHNFQDSLKTICKCGTDDDSCHIFFLHCLLFQDKRHILLSTVKNNESKLLGYSDLRLSQILHSGDTSLDVFSNSSTLNITIDFVICSKRLEELFYTVNFLFSTVTIFYQNLFCIILTFILIFVRTLYLCLFFNFNFLFFTFFGLFFD